VRFLPLAEFAIAQLHFLSVIIEHVKGLWRLGEKLQINERRLIGEYGAASFDSNIEKNVGSACQHKVGREAKDPKHQPLKEMTSTAMGRRGDHFNRCSCDSASRASERHN
jgi:hypothetical protein